MFGITTIVRKLRDNSKYPIHANVSVEDQVQTFLYELEKKLIRLEVSLRRVKDEPATIDNFIRLFDQIIRDIEESYTPPIEKQLQFMFAESMREANYARIFSDLKILGIQLKSYRDDSLLVAQSIECIENNVKMLLDHQLTRATFDPPILTLAAG